MDELLVLFSRTLIRVRGQQPWRVCARVEVQIEEGSDERKLQEDTKARVLTLVVQTHHTLRLRVCKTIAADDGNRQVVAKKLSERVAFKFNSRHRDREE
eukprot:6189157-Amphidinium_carterae.1